MFSKTSLHTSHASDRSGAGGILPHLTTLIIQDLGLVPGSGAGWTLFRKRHQRRNPQCRCAELLNRRGHNPGRCLSVYCPRRQRLQSLTSRQWIKYDLRCKVHSKIFISYCHLISNIILELLVTGKSQTFLNYKEQIEQLK